MCTLSALRPFLSGYRRLSKSFELKLPKIPPFFLQVFELISTMLGDEMMGLFGSCLLGVSVCSVVNYVIRVSFWINVSLYFGFLFSTAGTFAGW